MDRKILTVTVKMESYIAHPFWPEKERLIQIELHAHLKLLKNEDKKAAALKGQLDKEGLTMADYEALQVRAAREWYRIDPHDDASEIVVPRHQIAGCLVETINRTPKAINGGYNADSFRHVVRMSDFGTGKMTGDRVYSRYVKLDGSNKRSLQENAVIENFSMTGKVSVKPDVKPEPLARLLAYAFDEVGIGAARKMGFGRGTLLSCK